MLEGGEVVIPCEVGNRVGTVQWVKDGFAYVIQESKCEMKYDLCQTLVSFFIFFPLVSLLECRSSTYGERGRSIPARYFIDGFIWRACARVIFVKLRGEISRRDIQLKIHHRRTNSREGMGGGGRFLLGAEVCQLPVRGC